MNRNIIENKRGIALLITLSVITILVSATVALNRKIGATVTSAEIARDRVTLSNIAASGIHGAMAMLAKDRMESTIDSVQEDWANPEKVEEALQVLVFEDGYVDVKITDELGKIQLNALAVFPRAQKFNDSQRKLWNRFLHLAVSQDERFQETEPSMIINSIKDWLDSGDDDAISGLNGAETDYYEDLDPPYACKNDRFTHISELLLVRGITPELFYFLGGSEGISSYLTVYGMKQTGAHDFTYEGKVNINTADLPVLAALLPEGDESYALALFEYRMEKSDTEFIHDLSNSIWYTKAPGCSDIQIDPELITTSSEVFRIDATATLNQVEMVVTAIVKREQIGDTGKWTCRILSWETG